jgi:phosphoglycerate dehydrogenase-like enzyme
MNQPPIVYIHRLGPWYSLYMNEDNEARLSSFAQVVSGGSRPEPLSPQELAREMQGAAGILSLNGTAAQEITTAVLRQVGTVRVAVIAHWWHGLHDGARRMWEAAGVEVIDASDANSIAVAEWTVAAALMGVRRLPHFDRALKSGSPWAEPRREAGLLCESTVGLIGLGRVGREVARMLRALGATLIGYDAYLPAKEARAMGVRPAPLEELLRTADVISLHLPVTDETRGMLDAEKLSWIRDGAVFINSARAALLDEEAFLVELAKARFTAFLDVYPVEPLPLDHPLRSMEHVFITPHIAGDNEAMFLRCGRTAIEQLRIHLAER